MNELLMDSLAELLAELDIEGLIAQGGDPNEYMTEAEVIALAFNHLPEADKTPENAFEIVKEVWVRAFNMHPSGAKLRREKFEAIVDLLLGDTN
jgi:hypothetical protein